MFITNEELLGANLPEAVLRHFYSKYEKGIEFKNLVKDPTMNQIAHWCYLHCSLDEEEIDAYKAAFDISNSTGVFYSGGVSNSKAVINSFGVIDSFAVYRSKEILNSESVFDSSHIKNCKGISFSKFIDYCSIVYDSLNCSNSEMINKSTFVMDSNSIVESKNVTDSFGIFFSHDINNSSFLLNCSNMEESLFCDSMSDGKFYLFNKPLSEKVYFRIKEQLASFKRAIPILLHSDKGILINSHIGEYFSNFDGEFWNWAKTLPGYDPQLMYKITLDKQSF